MEAPFTLTPGQSISSSLGFIANSARIDNPTAQWWYVTAARRYIPPYALGVIVTLDGTQQANVKAETPPGQTSQIISNELGYIVFSESKTADLAGTSTTLRPVYYDRNPLIILQSAGAQGNNTLAETTFWTYTVPTGKKAFIETVNAVALILTMGVGGGNAKSRIKVNGTNILYSQGLVAGPVGGVFTATVSQGNLAIAGQIFLNAGDAISFTFQGVGGDSNFGWEYFGALKGIEFTV